MNKGQHGSSLVGKSLKFHASWRPSCRASAGSPTSYCWTPVAGSFGGWCSPADRWWLISLLLAAGPLCPGNSFSSTATASEAGAVSQPAPLSAGGGSPLLPLLPLVLLLRLGWSHIRLFGSPVAVFWASPGSPVRDHINSSFQAAATALRPQHCSFHSFFLTATVSRPLAPPFGGGTGGSAFRPTAPSPLTSMAYPIRGPGCCQRGGSM